MYALDSVIEELLGEPIRGSGVNAMFSCPWHQDRVPSFAIHRDEGMFQCFSCGARGGIASLARMLGEELSSTVRQDILLRTVNRPPPEHPNFAPLANQYIRELRKYDAGQALLGAYLRERPVSARAIDAFGVGYSFASDSLAFPYWRDDGTVRAIKYRRLGGEKSSETGSERSLYNVTGIRGKPYTIVAEGEGDTLSLWTALSKIGDSHIGVCGSPGASVSEAQWALWGLDLLFARRVFIAFDADTAGDKGAETALRVLGTERTSRLRPTRGKDWSEHLMNGGTFDITRLLGEPDDSPSNA